MKRLYAFSTTPAYGHPFYIKGEFYPSQMFATANKNANEVSKIKECLRQRTKI